MVDDMIEARRSHMILVKIFSEHNESVMGSFQNREQLGLGEVK